MFPCLAGASHDSGVKHGPSSGTSVVVSPVTPDVANLVDAGALLDAVVEAAAGHARLVAAVGDRHRRANLADHRADAVASVLNRHLTALENVWRFTTQC